MSGKPPKVLPTPIRLAIVVLLCLNGLVFPLLFLAAALVAWSIYTDLRNPRRKPTEWFELRWTTTAADPNWKEYFLKLCESPAERAFLEAMIADSALVPDEGLLTGSGLSLDLQVREPPYRLDFLANKWLVIEIDGAAYHSSAEAVAKDMERDGFLQAKGYSVLRIPAKLVFNDAKEAVKRVRAQLTAGRQVKAAPRSAQSGPRKAAASVVSFFEGVGRFVEEMDRNVTIARAVQEACSASTLAFETERMVISSALADAKSKIEVEDFCAGNEERKRLYNNAAAQIRRAIEAKSPHALEPAKTIEVPEFTAPPVHEDVEINERIQRTYRNLQETRTKFFSEARLRLHGKPRLQEHVRAWLDELGCGNCWEAIRPAEK